MTIREVVVPVALATILAGCSVNASNRPVATGDSAESAVDRQGVPSQGAGGSTYGTQAANEEVRAKEIALSFAGRGGRVVGSRRMSFKGANEIVPLHPSHDREVEMYVVEIEGFSGPMAELEKAGSGFTHTIVVVSADGRLVAGTARNRRTLKD